MGPQLPEVTITEMRLALDGGAIVLSTAVLQFPSYTLTRRGRAASSPGYEPPPMICAAVNPPDTRLFFLPPGGGESTADPGSDALVVHCRQMFSAFCSPFAIRDSPPRVSEEKH